MPGRITAAAPAATPSRSAASIAYMALAYLFHEDQPLPLRRGWVGHWMGASLVHPQHSLCTEESMRRWRTAGLPVNAWTVNDAGELRRLAALGVDGVFVDDPAHAIAVLEGNGT